MMDLPSPVSMEIVNPGLDLRQPTPFGSILKTQRNLLSIKIRDSVQADITAFMPGNLIRLAVVVNMSFWTRYSVRFLDI